jgi:hypothetical protein
LKRAGSLLIEGYGIVRADSIEFFGINQRVGQRLDLAIMALSDAAAFWNHVLPSQE